MTSRFCSTNSTAIGLFRFALGGLQHPERAPLAVEGHVHRRLALRKIRSARIDELITGNDHVRALEQDRVSRRGR